MQLVNIDVIGLHARERAVNGRAYVSSIHTRWATAYPIHAASGAGHFATQYNFVASLVFKPMPDDGLGARVGVCFRWHRVHFSRVYKIDAARQGIVELLEGLGLGVLIAVGHGTQADGRYI